jgi:hypothetical protein
MKTASVQQLPQQWPEILSLNGSFPEKLLQEFSRLERSASPPGFEIL